MLVEPPGPGPQCTVGLPWTGGRVDHPLGPGGPQCTVGLPWAGGRVDHPLEGPGPSVRWACPGLAAEWITPWRARGAGMDASSEEGGVSRSVLGSGGIVWVPISAALVSEPGVDPSRCWLLGVRGEVVGPSLLGEADRLLVDLGERGRVVGQGLRCGAPGGAGKACSVLLCGRLGEFYRVWGASVIEVLGRGEAGVQPPLVRVSGGFRGLL